jgi:hypothetical protein
MWRLLKTTVTLTDNWQDKLFDAFLLPGLSLCMCMTYFGAMEMDNGSHIATLFSHGLNFMIWQSALQCATFRLSLYYQEEYILLCLQL